MTTRLEIVTRARQKAHLENSTFVDTAAPLFVQEAYNEVYHLFASKGMHMLETDFTPTITGAATYTLPTDFYATLNVMRLQGSDYYKLIPVQPDLELKVRSLTGVEANYYKIRRTATNGRTIQFYPNPSSGTYTVHYIPECPVLSADNTAVITVGPSDALIACILAKKFCVREQEHNNELDDEIKQLYFEVNRLAEQVEMTSPMKIQDTRSRGLIDEFAFRYIPEAYW